MPPLLPTSSPSYTPLIEQALRVAARAHRHQLRKATTIPYITHPAAVALILVQHDFADENVLATALLHDVVEDTEYSLAELQSEFPPPIPDYVAALSERKTDDDGSRRPWHARKAEHLALLANAPVPVRAVALADKLHNLMTIACDLRAGEPVWNRFNAPREELLSYHRAVADRVGQGDERLVRLADECRRLIAGLE